LEAEGWARWFVCCVNTTTTAATSQHTHRRNAATMRVERGESVTIVNRNVVI